MEDFLFKCSICGKDFPADPDSMISLPNSSYILDESSLYLQWEGSYLIGNSFINDGISKTLQLEQVDSPEEMSNNAICMCPKCRG